MITGRKLDPELIDIIFFMFDTNKDGSLGSKEFIQVTLPSLMALMPLSGSDVIASRYDAIRRLFLQHSFMHKDFVHLPDHLACVCSP